MRDLVQTHTRQAHRYALALARKYHYFEQSDIEDIKSEAVCGLLRAAETYDPKRGEYWFYARHWVRVRVQGYIRWRQSGPATVSKHLTRNFPRTAPRTYYVDFDTDETTTLDRAPCNDRLLFAAGHYTRDTEQQSAQSEQLNRVWEIAESILSPRLLYVLKCRYQTGETLGSIGARMGVHRERVRQIEADAIERIQLAIARDK